jgi:type II secretory pathway component GspD/PulD (secretin)
MKELILGALLILFSCGCGRQAVAPAAAATAPRAAAVAQLEIRPAKFLEEDGIAGSRPGTNLIRWQVNIAEFPEDKIEELGLKHLFEMEGEKNSVTREEIGRSPMAQAARGRTNVTLNLRTGGYAGLGSTEAATNLINLATRTLGVDFLTYPPLFIGGTQKGQAAVSSSITIVLTAAAGGRAAEFSTNLSVGPTVTLRMRSASGDAVQLEAVARHEQFLGYARNEKTQSELKPPSPIFDVGIIGTRTDLPLNQVLLLGTPMQMQVMRTVERVPRLSEIPGLGRLFTKTRSQTNFVRQVVIIRREAQ